MASLRERVEALVKLRDAATPGPWEVRRSDPVQDIDGYGKPYTHKGRLYIDGVKDCVALMIEIWRGPNGPQPERDANAAFVAAAPEAVTLCEELLAKLEEKDG